MDERASDFARQPRALVVAAAGCGKTELLAKAVAACGSERQLVLTHTHAGVRVLRERLRELGVASQACRVETIDGFALRYAAGFPGVSQNRTPEPTAGCGWRQVRECCRRAFENRHVQHVFTRSYGGVFVDEYQDCTASQHKLLLRLAQLRPCRVVGDPLQGIFGFDRDDPLPDWPTEVTPEFKLLPALTEPHRWNREGTNRELGKWLTKVREVLQSGTGQVTLGNGAPVRWEQHSEPQTQAQVRSCFEAHRSCGPDRVVAVHNLAPQAHYLAKRLNGSYQSMEEVESKDLMKYCRRLEQASAMKRAACVVSAAAECIVSLPPQLRSISTALRQGRLPKKGKAVSECPELLVALNEVAQGTGFSKAAVCLDLIAQMPGVVLYRREPFRDLLKSCRLHDPAAGESLSKTAWRVRNSARRFGRCLPRRLVSRTLLVKGLEFDHAIVLDADGIEDAKNLYVALTRASKTLTVVSSTAALSATGTPAPRDNA